MTGERYPHAPGHRGVDTSIEAADALATKLGRLQAVALCTIKATGAVGLTSEELADRVGLEFCAIQPRTSELRRQGLIKDSGQRRTNRRGKRVIVWTAQASEQCT